MESKYSEDDGQSSSSTLHSEHSRLSSSSKEYERFKHRLDTKGIILQTYLTFANTDAALNRTLLLENTLYEEPISTYIPPIFFLIMYERTPYTRYFSPDRKDTEEPTPLKPNVCNTDFILKENKLVIREMLKSINCLPDSMEHCFLRLEHAGSIQSMFTETFPTPALRIGCLVRMKYNSFKKRVGAVDFLHDNGASNSDLYAINYSSNNCITTVTRYLEPLFRHALELQKAWSVDTTSNHDQTEDNGVFDVNFHLLDMEPEQEVENKDKRNDRPIFFVGSTDCHGMRSKNTPIKERMGCTSTLTTHDVSRFYQTPGFYGDRNGAAQLQSLPVIYVRHERDFICLSAVTEYNGSNVIFHVYYVWTKEIARALTELSTTVNTSNDNEICTVRMCICDVFETRIAAYIRMLDDAKICFWKKHTNTYIRLVMDPVKEELSYSRFVLNTLMTKGITSGKVTLQSCIEGSRKTTTGTIEMYPHSITIDCSKLIMDLDDGVSAFSASCKLNIQNATAYANADGAMGLPLNVLAIRQRRVGNMLLQFKVERIAELAYTMANEMYLGVLDLYGVGETNNSMRYDPVTNYQFLRTLVTESVYTSSTTFDTDLHTVLKDNNAEDEKLIPPPCASSMDGLYRAHEEKEILEFDIESAFPTIIDTFNISPETTLIMKRTDFNKMEKRLEGLMVSKDQNPFKLSCWCFVVPFTDVEGIVIVSLIPSIYKGYLSKIFTSLVLKRRTNRSITAYFYKRLANRLVGCMGQRGSDMFAIQCLAAVSSLCRTIIKRTLTSLEQSVEVLQTQTDGGLVQAPRKVIGLADEIQHAFLNTITNLLANNTIKPFSTLLKLKIREVNVCFIVNQNKYAIRYANDEKILKGHPAKYVPNTSAKIAVTEGVFQAVDNILRAGFNYSCKDIIGYVMDSIYEHMIHHNNESDDIDDFYFMERTVPFENTWEEEKVLDIKHLKYDQHCRFGDTIPLWPVIKIDGDTTQRGYVLRPQRLQGPVVNDRFAVLKNLINAWTLELCRRRGSDFQADHQSKGSYSKLFYSKLRQTGNNYASAIYDRACVENNIS